MTRTRVNGTKALLVGFLCCMAALLPYLVGAAELSLTPGTGTFSAGGDFSLTVSIDPQSDSVNAADGTISFDPSLLSVSSVSRDGSVFSLWTSDPSFSNTAGTLTFSGGTPSAFSTKGKVVTINFKAKTTGSAKVEFTKGSVLAADGKGTDVYKSGVGGTYTIGEGAPTPPPAAPKATPKAAPSDGLGVGPVPIAPVTTSSTHPKPDTWYSTTTIKFAWKPPGDVVMLRTILSQDENAEPTEETDKMSEPLVLTATGDGVWYLAAQYQNDSGWGERSVFKVQIDSVAPKPFDVSLVDGDTPKLAFSTEDELSGVDRYVLQFGATTVATIRAQDLMDGHFPVPAQEGGPQVVTVTAFDKAGNSTETKKELTLPLVLKPAAKAAADEAANQSPWTSERILTIIFALIIGALTSWIIYSRNTAAQQKAKLLRRVIEIGDKNDRVFGAMREEFEQMINEFDEKPQLTPAEREFLEKVKEVLDISEEIVDTGMDELKKEVRGQ